MSLRETRKRDRRKAMLDSAEEIFSKVGFSRTTMDRIAERAGVGVATVYKHFKSKGGILAALLRPDLEHVLAEGREVIARPLQDPGAAMAELISRYTHARNNWSSRRLLSATAISGVYNEQALNDLIREADTRVRQQVRDLLLILQGRGSVRADLHLEDATAVIFSVFNQHFLAFTTNEEIAASELFAQLNRRIRILFDDWSPRHRSASHTGLPELRTPKQTPRIPTRKAATARQRRLIRGVKIANH